MSIHLRIVAVAFALAVIASLSIGVGSAEASGAQCRGNDCTGLDPIDQHCHHDAEPIEGITFVNSVYEIRYSEACNAAWGRVKASSGSTSDFVTIFGSKYRSKLTDDRLSSDRDDSEFTGYHYSAFSDGGYDWTEMVSFTKWVRVCHTRWEGGTKPLRAWQECTDIR